MNKPGSEKKFDNALWEAYKTANERFAEAICGVYEENDLVWVHDYHLMRCPLELRKRRPAMKVSWFLHTPFPSSEIYRILPVRRELLEGLLCADLLGFHTYDYARHFLSSCSRVLEVESTPKGIEYKGHFCALGVFPIGIDPDSIEQAIVTERVQARIRELSETFAGRKILLGVDRLDYVKGMPHKLLGLELFLARYPEWNGRVTLIQVGVPTRTEVDEYKTLAGQVNELVGRINGNHGTLEYSPIHYINQQIPQEELFAIYNVADVCLVTSVRDGMNLVSYEYVVAQQDQGACSQKDGPGVLVLSEFAGSAQSLSGALRVNPWNTEEVATTIHQALNLSRVERELRQHKLYRYVTTHTASYWARSYFAEFLEVCRSPQNRSRLPRLPARNALREYDKSERRLIILDYDGTLTQIQSLPQLATPSPVITGLLDTLSRDPKNTVFIMSGRERRFMDTWLGKLRVGLAAEFGFCHRMPGEKHWQSMGQELDTSWKEVVQPIMQYFSERTPGTYIENKESSLAWHYRDADPHFGAWQAKDIQIHMEDVLSNLPLEILQGNRMVEVRHQGVNKSVVLEELLKQMAAPASVAELGEVDFVFCVGDDRSDEDMFQLLKHYQAQLLEGLDLEGGVGDAAAAAATTASHATDASEVRRRKQPAIFTVHVGTESTQAEFYIEHINELRRVLRGFATISNKDEALRSAGI